MVVIRWVIELLSEKLGWFYQAPDNLPSPYNCSASNSLPPGLLVRYVRELTFGTLALTSR